LGGQWVSGFSGKDTWAFSCDYSITSNFYGPGNLFLYGNIPWVGTFNSTYFTNGTCNGSGLFGVLGS
jgi:hypothetical protein